MIASPLAPPGRTAYINARLLDPATGLDSPGALLTEGAKIADFGPRLFTDGVPSDVKVVDLAGKALAPGLVDMRVLITRRSRRWRRASCTRANGQRGWA